MKRISLFITFLLLTFPAIAQESNWAFDLGVGAGKGTFSHPTFTNDISVVQYHFGATALYRVWNSLFFGLETRYEKVEQTTELAEAGANIRGSIWTPVSPVLLFSFRPFALRVSYQFLGNYELGNPNADGQTVTYKEPSGFRVGFFAADLIPIVGGFEIYFQNRSYKEQQIGDSEESSEFLEPVKTSAYGIEYKILF